MGAGDRAGSGTFARPRAPTREALGFYLSVTLVGAGVGLVAASFHALLDVAAEFRLILGRDARQLGTWQALAVLPVLCAFLAGLAAWLVRRFAPEAAGSGIPQVGDALETGAPIRWRRVLPVKFFGGLAAIGSGMVLGREGPTIHLGAGLAAMLSAWTSFDRTQTAHLVMAGAGAGLAAAFNAPLAGIVFVTEEMRRQFDFSFRALQAVILACLVATFISDEVLGQGPALDIATLPTPAISHVWTFLPLGIAIGAAGALLNRGLVLGLDAFDHARVWSWLPAALVGALVGSLIPFAVDVAGGGEHVIVVEFGAPMALDWLLVLVAVRAVLFILSYASGVPGGLFAPMLALGTLIGLAYGEALAGVLAMQEFPFGLLSQYQVPWTTPHFAMPPGVFAVAAMGALFAAMVRAPLTGIIVVVEMTGSYDLILPIIATSLMATFTAEALGGRPIYLVLLERSRRAPPQSRAAPPSERVGP